MSQFISRYSFFADKSKPHRILQTAKVAGVHISRLTMEPGVVAGNLYHKRTNVLILVTRGKVRFAFEHIKSKARTYYRADSSFGLIHQPPMTAIALKNAATDLSVAIFFSNHPLRGDDDFVYNIPLRGGSAEQEPSGVTHYAFHHDHRKPGRDLETVKVGKVYVSRLTVSPGVATGNLYHKKTKVILFVIKGVMRFKFVQVKTGQMKEFELKPGEGIVQVPPYVAIADRNVGAEPAVVVYFSTLPFRDHDDYPFQVYPEHSNIKT